jgi:hypothetical protein
MEPVELNSFRLKCNLITNSLFETESPCSVLLGETICRNYQMTLPIGGDGGSISYYPMRYTLCDSTPLHYSAGMPIGIIFGVIGLIGVLFSACSVRNTLAKNKKRKAQ